MPLSDELFAALAPTTAATLSPNDPAAGFAVLWDLIDEVPNADHRTALVALLGLGAQTGDVGARSAQVDQERHKRTISRRADKAIQVVVEAMSSRFRPAGAQIEIDISTEDGLWRLRSRFTWTAGRMKSPLIHCIGMDGMHDTAQFPHVFADPHDFDVFVEDESVSRVEQTFDAQPFSDFRISWSGDLPPTVSVTALRCRHGFDVETGPSSVELSLYGTSQPLLGFVGRSILSTSSHVIRSSQRWMSRPFH